MGGGVTHTPHSATWGHRRPSPGNKVGAGRRAFKRGEPTDVELRCRRRRLWCVKCLVHARRAAFQKYIQIPRRCMRVHPAPHQSIKRARTSPKKSARNVLCTHVQCFPKQCSGSLHGTLAHSTLDIPNTGAARRRAVHSECTWHLGDNTSQTTRHVTLGTPHTRGTTLDGHFGL